MAVAAGCTAGLAFASITTVAQLDRLFWPDKVSLAKGDRLRIINDDPFSHHVWYAAATGKFDSGELAPGETLDIDFARAGYYDLRCAIHPKMRLEVTVAD